MYRRVHCLASLCVLVCLTMVDKGAARIIPSEITKSNMIDWASDSLNATLLHNEELKEIVEGITQFMSEVDRQTSRLIPVNITKDDFVDWALSYINKTFLATEEVSNLLTEKGIVHDVLDLITELDNITAPIIQVNLTAGDLIDWAFENFNRTLQATQNVSYMPTAENIVDDLKEFLEEVQKGVIPLNITISDAIDLALNKIDTAIVAAQEAVRSSMAAAEEITADLKNMKALQNMWKQPV